MTLRGRVSWFWSYWRPHRYFLVFLAFFTLLSSAVTVAYPLAFRNIIDRLNAAYRDEGGSFGDAGSILETAVRHHGETDIQDI